MIGRPIGENVTQTSSERQKVYLQDREGIPEHL